MNARLLSPRPRSHWLVIALVGGALGCGGSSVRRPNAGAHGGGGGGGGGGALGGSSGEMAAAGTSSEATYAGVVLAMVTDDNASSTYLTRALFTAQPRPVIGGCPHCCCKSTERGLPLPEKPPDAGNITLMAADGSTSLATLVPAAFEAGSGTFYGMTELGWSWFAPLGDYAPVTSKPWAFGATLHVLAAGNEVEPFSGILRTGPALAGVTPPIGSSPVVIDHARPFEIAWTPEGTADATMLLGVPTGTGICYCDAPESAGKLTVDADVLSPVSSELTLARLSVSTVTSGNSTVALVGAVVQKGPVEVQ